MSNRFFFSVAVYWQKNKLSLSLPHYLLHFYCFINYLPVIVISVLTVPCLGVMLVTIAVWAVENEKERVPDCK